MHAGRLRSKGLLIFLHGITIITISNCGVSIMAQILNKVSEIREKAAAALEDVPDTLIGTVISLTLLTVVGLFILMVFGYMLTR